MRFTPSRRRLSAGLALLTLCLATPAVSLAGQGDGNGNGNGNAPGYHGNGNGNDNGNGNGNGNAIPPAPPAPALVAAPAGPGSDGGYHGTGISPAAPAVVAPAPSTGPPSGHASGTAGNGNQNDNGDGNGNHNDNGNGNGGHGDGSFAPPASHALGHASTVTSVAQVVTAPAAPAPPAAAPAPAAAAPAPPATAPAPAATAPAPAASPPVTQTPASTPAPAPAGHRPSGSSRSSTGRRGTTTRRRGAGRSASGLDGRPAGATAGGALASAAAAATLGTHGRLTITATPGAVAGSPAGGRSGRLTRTRPAPRAQQASTPLTRLDTALSSVPTIVSHLVPLPVPDWSKPIIAALAAICLLLALRAAWSGRRARRLEHQRVQLTADLALMQAALIPEIPEFLGGLSISAAYRPADGPGAGGDFYDAFALDDARTAVILGDVSGHGRTALRRAAHMHYTLRAYVEMGLDPRSALKLAGRVQREEDGDLFTTVAVAVHDAAAGTLTFASAGHPAPLLDGPDVAQPLRGSASPPLGWGVATGRRQTTLAFPAGTRACFYTDGVTEARSADGLLGRERLAALAAGLQDELSASALLAEVRRHCDGVHDDMAACLITAITGDPVAAARVEELEVDDRQLAAGQGERFLAACGASRRDARRALAAAAELAADAGTALLRVTISPEQVDIAAVQPATLTLEAPHAHPPAVSATSAV